MPLVVEELEIVDHGAVPLLVKVDEADHAQGGRREEGILRGHAVRE